VAIHNQETIRLTMAQALVKYLQMQYSERDGYTRRLIPSICGIFGHGNVAGLGQAIQEYGADLPYIQPHNEQSMVHTASAYAKANRRLATLACTASIGPGSTNMVTGAAAATINRLPVLLLPSDYYATRYQGPVLQQLEHPISADVSVNDCFRPVSRFFDRISRPEQLLTALPEAMRVLTDPADCGAVTLALPEDIQAHAYDYPTNLFKEHIWSIDRRMPDSRRIEQAIEMITTAQHPMIIAGGGVLYSEAELDLLAFAEKLGIPVGETFAGKGAMPDDTPMALGGYGVTGTGSAGRLMRNADLVICIGTRLTDFTTGSQSAFENPQVKFIGIGVNGHDAYKQGALPIVADAKIALKALLESAERSGIQPNPEYLSKITDAKQAWKRMLEREVFVQHESEAMSQLHAINVINEQAQSGDIIIAAAGGPPGDLHQLWETSGGRRCHLEFGYSCMGYEIPAGLGVRMGQPEGEVYVLIGDGTYLMQPTELATAMQEGLKITVLIMNNHGFQIIRRLQMGRVGISFGNEFRARDEQANELDGEYLTIDFAKNAESLGARAWNISTPDELNKALMEARQETRSCVIVAETEPHRYGPSSEVWWDVASAEVSKNSKTKDARSAYESERFNQQKFNY
jgi:3D-(3,5/4)-trihydroxycyclohexane-1,2-dione acylhydrolase (decyclizing)